MQRSVACTTRQHITVPRAPSSRTLVLSRCQALLKQPSNRQHKRVLSHGNLKHVQASPVCPDAPQHSARARLVAAGVCGFLLCCPPIQAASVPQQLVLLDSNAAIVSRLKQMQQTKQKFGTQDPGSALASRFTGMQQQLQRIELLVKIQQYGNARMQLREGSFKSLRSDLRYESEYRGVQPGVSRSIVEGVELLDRQLRAEEPMDTIMTGIKKLQDQLQKLVDQAQPLQ